jgi:transposase
VASNFTPVDREQLLLMPPSVADWLPEDHLAWFVIDVVAELDVSSFLSGYRLDGRGGAAYDPRMMLALLVYAYCVGERSSRRIEKRLVEDVAFRVIAANQQPDHATSLGSAPTTRPRSQDCSAKSSPCALAPACCTLDWSPSMAPS